jgi:uncharacterized 2Fe-2S/4Fe-4S cluster protein (DUF4445 family)
MTPSVWDRIEAANESSMDYEEAIEYGEDILSALDDLPDRAENFAESVREKVESMVSWMVKNQKVTEKMITALQNIRGGVDRWLS